MAADGLVHTASFSDEENVKTYWEVVRHAQEVELRKIAWIINAELSKHAESAKLHVGIQWRALQSLF